MKNWLICALALVAFHASFAADPVETDERLHSDGAGWKLDQAKIGDEKLPRILFIGDSILAGYRKLVIEQLKGRAYVDTWVQPYHQGQLASGNYLTSKIAEVLAHGPYDLIVFNMGLHGWKEGQIPDDQFIPLTEKLVRTLRENAPDAQLVWLSTTQITEKDPRPEFWKLPPPKKPYGLNAELNPIIVKHNRMAEEAMKTEGVPVVDLYAVLLPHLEWARGDMFHWKAPAYELMTVTILDGLKPYLPAPPNA